jgi:hypothetical protein
MMHSIGWYLFLLRIPYLLSRFCLSQSLLNGIKNQLQRLSTDRMIRRMVIKHRNAKIVRARQVSELNIIFMSGLEWTQNLQRPDAVSPLAFCLHISPAANERRNRNTGETCSGRELVRRWDFNRCLNEG